MPSQPDYDRVYQLNPELKPKDPTQELLEEKAKNAALVAELAALKGVTPEEVAKCAEQATLSAESSPLAGSAEDAAAPIVAVTKEEALFFASKEGKKFYPMDKLESSKTKPENLVFFKTADDALAASYSA